MQKFMNLWRDEEGTTSVEYAVMLAMILMVVIGAISAFGQQQRTGWGNIEGEITAEFQARGIE